VSPAAAHPVRALTLELLGGYVVLVALVNLVRLALGTGSILVLVAQALVLWAVWLSLHSRSAVWATIGDWLPLLALPVLYWELPWTMIGPSGRLFDAVVQGWDQTLFGAQPATTLAAAIPSRALSELLHLAYLSYYVIIYLPPLLLYSRIGRRGYFETVFAFTLTVIASFAAFSLFPVEGPRFAWGASQSVPPGPIRNLTLLILERGSARGTAFPSSHVALALAQSLSSLVWRRNFGLIVATATTLLAVGAVYGGFHYASDILAGAALGTATWLIARRISSRTTLPAGS
jgi:membrane-associated phospholipid phosphatase